jgi:hypothetical protein
MGHFKVSVRLLAITLLIAGCASTATTASVPLPQDLQIVSPNPDLAPEIRAFSGKWFGVWDNVLDHILVLEQITPPNATVIYAYGIAPSWNVNQAAFFRVQGQIGGGTLKLLLRRPATVTYRMQPDGTLDATYEWSGGISKAKMKRLEQ